MQNHFVKVAISLCLLLGLIAVASAQSCQSISLQLLAGQTIDVGSVKIHNTESNLQVELSTKDGWMITEVHVYAGKTAPETVAPGQFPFSRTLTELSSSFLAILDLPAGTDCSSAVAIAVHAVVSKGEQTETAWARGSHTFQDTARWGWWADYQAQCGCGGYDSGTNSTNSGNVWQCCSCSDPSASPSSAPYSSSTSPSSSTVGSPSSGASCVPYVTKVFGGQTIYAADLVITNDASSITLAVSTQPTWYIAVIHVYIGTGPIPSTRGGTPIPGQFPFQISFADPVQSWANTWTLEELALEFPDFHPACGESYYVLVHFDLVGPSKETGWAFGETPFSQFGSNRWGWAVNYTFCCPPPPPDTNEGCTYTQGYWKNHNILSTRPSQKIAWPLPEDTMLCSKTWLSILQTPVKGNKWYILAHQWIAAKLNVANGASASAIAQDLIDGDTLLNLCSFTTGRQEKQAVAIAGRLGSYNEGLIGPGHCDDNTISTDVCECRCPVADSESSGSLPAFDLNVASEPRQVLGLAIQKNKSSRCRVELVANSGEAKLVVTNPITKQQLIANFENRSVEFDIGDIASSVVVAVETSSSVSGSVSITYLTSKATSCASSVVPAALMILGAIVTAIL